MIVLSDAVGLGQGAAGALITALIVAGVIGYGWWSQARTLRTCHALRGQLLAGHPVAYVCGFEMSSSKSMVSSDADQLVVWDIERGQLVEAMRIPRGSVHVTRDRVQTAAAKKYDGIRLAWSSNPRGQLGLALYNVSFWGLVFPMRGAELDAAVDALRRGGAG
ncbi:MAG: hypothetical protein ABI611_20995 [Solirubrobacteraceae bacterium]